MNAWRFEPVWVSGNIYNLVVFERRDKVVRVIQPSSSRFQCRGVRSYWARKGRRLAIIQPRPGVTGRSELKWPRVTPLVPQGHPKTDFARVHIAIRLLLESDSYHSGVSRSSKGGAQRVRHQWTPVGMRQYVKSRENTQNHDHHPEAPWPTSIARPGYETTRTTWWGESRSRSLGGKIWYEIIWE